MFANPFAFVAVASLLARGAFAIDCYQDRTAKRSECDTAISQIVYGQDGTLSADSKTIGYTSGNCSIILLNPKGASPTRKEVETGFHQILNNCQPELGGGNLPSNKSVFLNIGNRGDYAAYDSDFPYLQETCGLNQNAPDTTQADCMKAYASVLISVEGQFLDKDYRETSSVKKTYGTCTISIYTSDESNIVANTGNVRPVFENMLTRCNGKSGVVSMQGGAQGKNGRLFLKSRSSVPCRGLTERTKQICH